MGGLVNLVNALLGSIFQVCLFKAKNRVLEFVHQQMNMFEYVRCHKTNKNGGERMWKMVTLIPFMLFRNVVEENFYYYRYHHHHPKLGKCASKKEMVTLTLLLFLKTFFFVVRSQNISAALHVGLSQKKRLFNIALNLEKK